jgi:predicted TIM-barrel fold metal-dependent hydrolase
MPDATPVIDVHHHFLPRSVFDQLKAEAGGARRLVNDRLSITLSDDLHRVESHLQAMDEGGVQAAILTYSGVSVLGMPTCRRLNDGLAEVQRGNPGRLYGAVHVPLQEPDLAPTELERGIRDLGLTAVALPTSVHGVTLDMPALRPLWRKIAELERPVILHPALLPEGATTDYSLERACARPFDTTIAAARLAYGVLPEFPSLTFVLPHLGGASVFLRGRLAMFFKPPDWAGPAERRDLALTRRDQHAQGLDALFDQAWSRFYYDTAGTGGWPAAVQMAAEVVTPSRMLFGSDYPLETYSGATVRELVEMIEGLDLDPESRQAIAGRNAARQFGLS